MESSSFIEARINRSKTQIFFSHNTLEEVACNNTEKLGFSIVDDLGNYLGMSIFHQKVSS